MHQTHGTAVAVVDGNTPPVTVPRADAMVTTRPGTALAVLVADCAPVLLADESAGVVAVAHAGRRGVAGGVGDATLSVMSDLGATPASTTVLVGPSVCARCYPVPATLQDEVAARVPATRARTPSGEPALDVRAGIEAQLRAAGVQRVEVDPGCTVESDRLYSYRRDRVTGRFAGVAVLA